MIFSSKFVSIERFNLTYLFLFPWRRRHCNWIWWVYTTFLTNKADTTSNCTIQNIFIEKDIYYWISLTTLPEELKKLWELNWLWDLLVIKWWDGSNDCGFIKHPAARMIIITMRFNKAVGLLITPLTQCAITHHH